MSTPNENFWAVLVSLWLRLMTVGAISSLFVVTLQLPEKVSSWRFALTTGEIIFEVVVYILFAALIGVALATLCTAATAPFLFYRGASRQRVAEVATKIAVSTAAFVDFAMVMMILVAWAGLWGKPKAIVFTSYGVAFAVVLGHPRWRKQLLASLDDFLGEKATRRNAIAIGLAFAALVATEWVLGKTVPVDVMAKLASPPSGPNVLLITFDALSAEDMSVYGYRLPTTPRIDEFARKSSVFTNFYSTSTFTTPSIAAILTGLHPSENHVYRLEDRLSNDFAGKTLPHWMRAAGYATGASISNPFAYFVSEGAASEFDFLPEPAYRPGGFRDFWAATRVVHQRQPFGSRAIEFWAFSGAWDFLPALLEPYSARYFGSSISGFPPTGSFAQASEVVNKLPERFFLWVHVMAPHGPYLPAAPHLGRFLPSDEMRTEREQSPFHGLFPHYTPDKQNRIDKARLRYDEFIADADSAFGEFLSSLEKDGRLRNTAVIVSSDHGESFEGGVYSHGTRYQTRPEIHIPLIIRMPGQEHGHRVAVTADQTVLVPTVLDIAGLPRPDWMPGRSLLPWLTQDGGGEGEGLAFTQYLWTSSIFKPLVDGTVGVIDGRHQYILDLATGKGLLRPLAEAQIWNRDHSAEDPALAETLRAAIYSRFPGLPRKAQ